MGRVPRLSDGQGSEDAQEDEEAGAEPRDCRGTRDRQEDRVRESPPLRVFGRALRHAGDASLCADSRGTSCRCRPAPGAPPPDDKPSGADLILYEMATGNEMNVGNVSDFAFDKKGNWLAWIIDAQDKIGNGVEAAQHGDRRGDAAR